MASSFSYAIFRYVKDARDGQSIPVGVALWSHEGKFSQTRFVSRAEKVRGINRSDDLPFIELEAQKINSWQENRELPYQRTDISPYMDDWWKHVQRLLIHRVQVSEPLSVDCDSSDGIEALFLSVVKLDQEVRHRIDSILRRALGTQIAAKFTRGAVEGYQGHPVKGLRVFKGAGGEVVLDTVNLSSDDAPAQADGIVGKLQRASKRKNDPTSLERTSIVAYLSSPHGLNGETYLRSWIEEGGGARTFDLRQEQNQLREAAEEAIERASFPLLKD